MHNPFSGALLSDCQKEGPPRVPEVQVDCLDTRPSVEEVPLSIRITSQIKVPTYLQQSLRGACSLSSGCPRYDSLDRAL